MHRCPNCGSHKQRVFDTRTYKATVRRRRGCLICDERWTTFEVTEAAYAALRDIDGMLDRIGRSIATSAAVLDDARGEGLLIQQDFGLLVDSVKRRKRGRVQAACEASQATGA